MRAEIEILHGFSGIKVIKEIFRSKCAVMNLSYNMLWIELSGCHTDECILYVYTLTISLDSDVPVRRNKITCWKISRGSRTWVDGPAERSNATVDTEYDQTARTRTRSHFYKNQHHRCSYIYIIYTYIHIYTHIYRHICSNVCMSCTKL